jgi:large subunit ribosomal protein L24
MKITKGDTVQVLRGKDAGKTGVVVRVIPSRERVSVEGINSVKRRRKPRRKGEKGQIVEIHASIPVSNVMLVCPKCSKMTRIGYERNDVGKKIRFCKKCKAHIV